MRYSPDSPLNHPCALPHDSPRALPVWLFCRMHPEYRRRASMGIPGTKEAMLAPPPPHRSDDTYPTNYYRIDRLVTTEKLGPSGRLRRLAASMISYPRISVLELGTSWWDFGENWLWSWDWLGSGEGPTAYAPRGLKLQRRGGLEVGRSLSLLPNRAMRSSNK